MGTGSGNGRYFDRGFPGDRARLIQYLYQVYLEEFEKRWRDRLLYTTIFKRVLDNIQIKKGHSEKVKTNGKALEVSIQMNWILKGLRLLMGRINCSRTEYSIFVKRSLSECQQLKNETYLSDLALPEALKPFLGKITKQIPGVTKLHA